MPAYAVPKLVKPPKVKSKQVLLVTSGDLRLAANQTCWPAQKEMEDALAGVLSDLGYELVRAHAYKADEKHGFISSQKEGMEVLARIDPKAKLIVAEAVWQYSHHVLAGLLSHEGPILTVANWSGQWPGLVGMLNLNASLTKAGKRYSTLWAEDFQRRAVCRRAEEVAQGRRHPASHAARQAFEQGQDPIVRAALGRGARRGAPPRKSRDGRLRRGLHGDVQRDHSRRALESSGGLQGTTQPVEPLLRNHSGARRRGPGGPPLAR